MTKTRWLNKGEDRAWRGFRRVMTLLPLQISRDLMTDSSLSDADYEVLSNLSECPDNEYRFKDLAGRMLWSKSRLSHHLTRMESRLLIRRIDDDIDGRGAVIVLTKNGVQAVETAAPHHVASVREHFIDLLTPDQLTVLAEISEIVVDHLEHTDAS